MDELSRKKGQELDWKAVVHENTDHHHIHICLMGRDKDGGMVRLNRSDYKEIIRAGDRQLEREYFYERLLDREVSLLVSRDDYKREGDQYFKELFWNPERQAENERIRQEKLEQRKPWNKEKAIEKLPDDEKIEAAGKTWSKFNTREELLSLDEYLRSDNSNRIDRDQYSMMWTWIGVKGSAGDDFYEKEARGVKDFRDYDEFKRFEDDLRKALRGEEGDIPKRVIGEQRILEQSGRLSDYHYVYTKNMEKERIEEIGRTDPDKADWAAREVEDLNRHDDGRWNGRKFDLDRFLYGCQPAWDVNREYNWTREGATREAPVLDPTDERTKSEPTDFNTPEAEEPKKTEGDFDILSTTPDRQSDGDSQQDPDSVRIDLIGGTPQAQDEEHDKDIERDFFGNEI
jgi:hypothetical protein